MEEKNMDAINKIWPQWEIVDLIGTGAFGKVYKAKREQLENISYAAIKVLHIPSELSEIKDLQRSGMDFNSIHSYFEDMVKNLLNEIKVMESLKTANNIVGIEDYEVIEHTGEVGWDIYIRMELLTDLGSYLELHELTNTEVVKLGIDLCTALVACEKVNIIHRDIKIDNVFINQFGSFKLGDFGISKQLEKTQSAMSQKGTTMYMAPEIFRGEQYNHTVDIYSLGILMYRLLNNGRFPFLPADNQALRYDDAQRAMEKRLSGEKMENPCFADENLSRIIRKACAFSSADRYQSAEAMLYEIKTYYAALIEEPVLNISASKNAMKEDKDEKTVAAFNCDDVSSNEPDKINNNKDQYVGDRTVAAFSNMPSNNGNLAMQETEKDKKTDYGNDMEDEIDAFGDMPLSDTQLVHHDSIPQHQFEKKRKNKKVWIIAAICFLLLLGGGSGYYLYRQYQEKQERNAEAAQYNEQIKETQNFLNCMEETVDAMQVVISKKSSVASAYAIAYVTKDLGSSSKFYQAYVELYNEILSNESCNKYIFKPGVDSMYTYEEAMNLLNDEEEIKNAIMLVEENIKTIPAQEEKLAGYPQEISQKVIEYYQGQYVNFIQTYQSYNEELGVESLRAKAIMNDADNFDAVCEECKNSLDSMKRGIPKLKKME